VVVVVDGVLPEGKEATQAFHPAQVALVVQQEVVAVEQVPAQLYQ
jgi:hypothetical protein